MAAVKYLILTKFGISQTQCFLHVLGCPQEVDCFHVANTLLIVRISDGTIPCFINYDNNSDFCKINFLFLVSPLTV